MPTGHEVTQAIPRVREGDDQAVEVVWRDYFARLVSVARRRLSPHLRRSVDEEDVALSAMFSFCRGMEAGKYTEIENRDDLWKILVTITVCKVAARYKHEYAKKRGGRDRAEGGHRLRGESVFLHFDEVAEGAAGLAEVAVSEPTPELAAEVVENCHRMLDCLDEVSREIALLKLEGYSQSEIAEKMGVVRETVNRKISRIKDKWRRMGSAPRPK
jgi:RNA polymerase sigma factor (sigma-70 family)